MPKDQSQDGAEPVYSLKQIYKITNESTNSLRCMELVELFCKRNKKEGTYL